ncbi:MAG: UbiA family prenyltransferase [Planctomycetes bacterium]|nr:UbiA family prenyltransferase [Planctomycetota bacterium]MCC7172958.1 UbiA family prenyltransferase [Planctomycetota bacterium]
MSPLADVLAGGATAIAAGRPADSSALGFAALAGTGCFVFGMTLNDLVDRAKDTIHSPQRPLPSGRASVGAARAQAGIAAVLALGSAAFVSPAAAVCVATMLACIVAYDVIPGHGGAFGVLLLGAIRGLDLALGGFALGAGTPTYIAALGYALFIGAIAGFARMEDGEVAFDRSRVLRATGLLAFASFATPMTLELLGAAKDRRCLLLGLVLALAGIARWWSVAGPLVFGRRVDPSQLRRCVGIGLSGLFAFDAAIAFTCGVPAFGIGIVVAFALAQVFVRALPPS